MKKTLIVVAIAFVCLFGLQAEAQVTNSSTPGLAISNTTNPCSGADGAGGVSDIIAFTEAGTISDVDVAVEIEHTWRGDLQFHVEYDGGGAATTLSGGMGGSDDDYFATFDDEAASQAASAFLCAFLSCEALAKQDASLRETPSAS